ncbi:MAG: SPOR domain-containing protein [Sphingomicrobium sp.]
MKKPLRIFAAIAAAALAAPPAGAQSVRAGIEAWQKADYPAAVGIWRPLAEAGDADAAFNLGQAYRLGRGIPISLSTAKSWFERAAAKGHIDAQTTLGLLLFQNNEQKDGLRWLKAAAEQGEARALLVYGTALFNGDSVTQDTVLGYAYVSRAAAQGFAPAKDTLAELDKIMPLADRKKGVALARIKAKKAPPPVSKAVKPVKPPKPARPVAVATAPAALPAKDKPAPVTAPAAAASGVWRIQLGAFGQRGAAEALYQRVAGKSALAGRRAFYIPVGAVTRLQVGPFETRAAAQAACNALKPQACFPAK